MEEKQTLQEQNATLPGAGGGGVIKKFVILISALIWIDLHPHRQVG